MTKQTKELTTTEDRLELIQRVADDTSIAKLHDMPQVTRAMTLARGIGQLRELFDGEVLDTICTLMDSNLGFRTDRAPGSIGKDGKQLKPYPKQVVRDCAIEALLRGANMIGNEFNILVGRMYLTKEFYERVVRELVSDLRVVEGVPHTYNGGALVSMSASWVFNGRQDSIDCVKTETADMRIPVRVNAGMGTDAILGKAYRKLYAKIHRRVTGSTWLEEETGGDVPSDGTITVEAVEAAPEPEPEAVTEETDPVTPDLDSDTNPVFKGIEELLSGFCNLADVNSFQEQASGVLNTDADHALLQEWCDWRREQIRETRGERSNGAA